MNPEVAMETQVEGVLATLQSLGTPAELRELAKQGFGPTEPLPANAHIHLPPNSKPSSRPSI